MTILKRRYARRYARRWKGRGNMCKAVSEYHSPMVDMPDGYGECQKCGCSAYWYDCSNCGGKGYHDDLWEQDPLWYDEGDTETCDWCKGEGGHWHCPSCDKTKKKGGDDEDIPWP